jgi:hypothetical protein
MARRIPVLAVLAVSVALAWASTAPIVEDAVEAAAEGVVKGVVKGAAEGAAVGGAAKTSAAGALTSQASSTPPTPEYVARQVQDRDTGRDSRAESRMRLFDRQNRVRERTMTLLALRGSSGKGDRTLVRFSYPNDIKNTAFLVWEHPGHDDERFLYLPALGRVRRIAGAEKQESFVGSDLSYEDIGGRDVAEYTYAFADSNAEWTSPDGTKHQAWALESRAKDGDAAFPRTVSLVLKDRFIAVHADIFNWRNERAKVFDVKRLERVDGIWTVLDLVVANERDRTRTELTTTAIRYNTGLAERDFDRRELERVGP